MPSVGEIARAIDANLVGNEQLTVARVASFASASPGDLVFVEKEEDFPLALDSNSTAIIASSLLRIMLSMT